MEKIPNLTYKIVALPYLPEAENIEEAIDWAIQMIEYGYESPTLFMLAGEQKPLNYFEGKEYLCKVFKELGITEKTEEEAILSYAYFYILQISIGKNVKENLNNFCTYCSKNKNSFDDIFHHIDRAWEIMEAVERDVWEIKGFGEMKLNEIENFTIQIAKNWIQNYKVNIF